MAIYCKIQDGMFFNSETFGVCWNTAQRCNEEENAKQRVNGVIKVGQKGDNQKLKNPH